MSEKVVHFTDTDGFGGAEMMLLTLLEHTDRDRWTPVLMHYPNEAAMELASAARRVGVETRVAPVASGNDSGARGIASLARALQGERAAVFHAHLAWLLRCTSGLFAARLARIPCVVATQQLYGLPRTARQRARQWRDSLLPHRYVAVSHAMARDLRGVVARPDRVTVVHNAIEVARFERPGNHLRRTFTTDRDRPILLTLARLHHQKGLTHLLAAAQQVGGDFLILIAGEGPERQRLEAQAHATGVADRIAFLGRRDDVPDLLAACDVYVLPSLYEGLPVSVLEAMAAAKPVVASRIGGTDEAVEDGETGTLVAPGDATALARAIQALIRDPALRSRMGAAGRVRVAERFSAAAMAHAIDRLYNEVLGPRKSSRAPVHASSTAR